MVKIYIFLVPSLGGGGGDFRFCGPLHSVSFLLLHKSSLSPLHVTSLVFFWAVQGIVKTWFVTVSFFFPKVR